MQDRIFNMLVQQDEITWQSIIYDLIRTEQMDPWDIDISVLSKKYIDTVNKLKEMNFFISGKVLLASAIMLKIKSHKLMEEDIAGFDSYLFNSDEELSLGDLEEVQPTRLTRDQLPKLTIKTPQARKRKVNLQDLMSALQKALEVNQRKILRKIREENPTMPHIPERKIEISKLIKEIYEKITGLFQKKENITFTKLLPSDKKEDKILTLMPLLHLDTQGKINLVQEEPFGEIKIYNAQ